MSSSKGSAILRNHALDGLRACAASLIVVFHLGLTGLIGIALGGGKHVAILMHAIGTSGVDLFFTLSAVVLLRPYLGKVRKLKIGEYFWRRIKRLWPPFLGAWLLAGATVALIAAYPTWWPSAMPEFDWQAWGSQAFIAYVGKGAYNFAWWTLTIEVMFYVIAPFLVVVLAGRSPRNIAAAFIASALLAQAAMLMPATSTAMEWTVKFMTYGSCFMGGIVLAMHPISRRIQMACVVIGTIFVVGNAVDVRIDSHVGFGLIYMALVAQSLDESSVIARWLSRPGLVWLGERSYSLFLTHYSVIALACWLTSLWMPGKSASYFLVSRMLALGGALVVACALFELIECRFARGLLTTGQWWPNRRQPTKQREVPV